ncbi:unnamed protein product [Didymodactylos carnosus]|uniref:Uncharacterized protein n=1 Tax=Didymodactylos carnosus TaxID=1234261 RepID=A0A814SJV7_9BILA|nr:unnamed protein product [Didymodactylos carnosus]CAF1621023.1 unnamed protein product [Didymodactylos carnosus]CAF3912115.1 unnamed protein product [Didymodactylos carnosus]CAF4440589.1 unnamed protein product [Didymodactylos carnosus]
MAEGEVVQILTSQLNQLINTLHSYDVDNEKLQAIIDLKRWKKTMLTMIENTFETKMHEIETITNDLKNELNKFKETKTDEINKLQKTIDQLRNNHKQNEATVQHIHADLESLTREIESFRCDVVIRSITEDENFDTSINVIKPVNVGCDVKDKELKNDLETKDKRIVSKVVTNGSHLAIGLAKTLVTHCTTTAVGTSTLAAASMAKTAAVATVCGVGVAAIGLGKVAARTTRGVMSLLGGDGDN